MKRTVAIVFAFLIAWPLLLKVVIFTSWQANREYIAQNLCEKRDNPDSDCEGSCHLAKQIENADESRSPFLPYKHIEKLNLPVYDKTKGQKFNTDKTGLITTHPFENRDDDLTGFLYINAVFHPPEAKV